MGYNFTKSQVEKFNKMFILTAEYDAYYSTELSYNENDGSTSFNDDQSFVDRNYVSHSFQIDLPDCSFHLPHGAVHNGDDYALELFNRFIHECGEDPSRFEQLLDDEDSLERE